MRQDSTLAKDTAKRKIDQAEQELWQLTSADQPDAGKIEAKIKEIEKLRGDERLAFIRSVGEAAKVLTDEQRKSLSGFASATPAPTIR
jgi:Spy/CpxP family protein refolding chaperone